MRHIIASLLVAVALVTAACGGASAPAQSEGGTSQTQQASSGGEQQGKEDQGQQFSTTGAVMVQPAQKRHSGLTRSVTPFDTQPVVVNGIRVRLIGAEFGAEDKVGIGMALGAKTSDDRDFLEAFASGFGRGLAQGMTGQTEELKKRDAELALYFEMRVDAEGNSPRDAKVADVPVEVLDDQGAAGIEVSRTYGWGPMKPGEVYVEMLKVAVYSDSKRFFVRVGGDGGVTWAFDAPHFIE